MNDLEQHFKKHTENIRMTGAEKSAMRFRIQKEISSSPSSSPTPSPYIWMFAPRMIAMLGVLLLVVVSTGSAYAAEGSLPGTPLYPVKTKIVEPLKVALAPTVQAKAQANADIAATRVHEAQTLAAQGALTPKAVQEISDNYNAHAEAALALAANIDAQDNSSNVHDSNESDQNTVVDVTVGATTAAEPAETASSTSAVIAVTATAPATLSIKIETPPSKNGEDENETATSSGSGTRVRNAMTLSANTNLQKNASTTRAAEARTASSTTKQNNSRSFVRTLRASLSAQAQILEQLDAQVRLGKDGREERGDN